MRGWNCCCNFRRLCFGWSAGRLSPSNNVPSEAECLMSANSKESLLRSDLFFFYLFPGVLADLWTMQYPLFTVLCQTPKSVYSIGFYYSKIKPRGDGSWGRCYSKGEEFDLKEKGMLLHLFSDLLYRFFKKQTTTTNLNLFLFQYFLGVCIYNIFQKDSVDPSFVGPATN